MDLITIPKAEYEALVERVKNLERSLQTFTLKRSKQANKQDLELPSVSMVRALKESKHDIETGNVSPSFTTAADAVAWLHNPKRRYANRIDQKV